jgi:predicted nucleic acid-binding protein
VSGLLLVDKSAYVHGVDPAAHEDELCLCPVTELEILFSARSASDYEALAGDLAAFRTLQVDAGTFAAARGGQSKLARLGMHRLPIPDLLIAACAEQHGAGVLHVDRHFEALARVFEFVSIRA